jgi:hypothetical protein
LGSYREACYDPFTEWNRFIHRETSEPMWKAQLSMNANGTSTEEDFEIIIFIEDNAPFTMLPGNPWIERDQARKKEEEFFL